MSKVEVEPGNISVDEEEEYRPHRPHEDTPLINPAGSDPLQDEEEQVNMKGLFKNWNLSTLKKRAPYYIPVLGWLPKYTKNDLLYDLLGGITVSCVLIPQALSLASLAQLPPVYGLYTAFAPLITYSFLGTSKHLQVGPEAAVSLMTGQLLLAIHPPEEGGAEDVYPFLAHTIALFVGLFALLAGFLRLGYLDSILSKAMASGFITAVAMVIMVEQLLSLFGIRDHWHEPSSTIEKIIFFFKNITASDVVTVSMGLSSLAFLFIFNFIKNRFPTNRFLKFFPFILLLVIISILLTWGLGLSATLVGDEYSSGLIVLGKITGGFQMPGQFDFERSGQIVTGSVLIMIIGFIESVVCTKRFADKNGYGISDNRELVALGASNALGGVFGAYPAFGALSRTNLMDQVQGKTQMAGFFSSIVILFTILFMLPLFEFLPKCVMAAVVFFAGFNLVELESFFFLVKVRAFQDVFLYFMTFSITLAVSIQVGVLVSIGVSLGLVVREVSGPTFNVLGKNPQGKYKPVEDGKDVDLLEEIIIVRFKDSLFYAKIGFLRDRFRRVEKFRTLYAHPSDNEEPLPLTGVIMDISRMRTIDASALKLLTEITKDYVKKGIKVAFVKIGKQNINKFKKAGITGAVGENYFFNKIQDAVDRIRADVESERQKNVSLN